MSAAVVHQSPEMAKSLTIVNMMMERLGVKLLAFDFDLTLLDIDTGGNKQTPEELARTHLRPCFRAIVAAGFKVGLQMCVVSYNHRKDLIAGVLKSAFPTVDTDELIPIEVFKKAMQVKIKLEAMKSGKERHIKRVVKELKDKSGKHIEPEEIFLFDDYGPNIDNAIKNKHLTFKVRNDIALDSIYSYIDGLCSSRNCGPSDPGNKSLQQKREIAEKVGHAPSPVDESGHDGGWLVTRVIIQQNSIDEWKEGGVWRMRSNTVIIHG